MALGQIPRSIWGEIVEWLKFAARLPIIGLVILTTAMFSWIGFWFVVRFTTFIFNRYLSSPW